MFKVKNLREDIRKLYLEGGSYKILQPGQEIEVECKPQEHPAFKITENNKKEEVQETIKEEESSETIE